MLPRVIEVTLVRRGVELPRVRRKLLRSIEAQSQQIVNDPYRAQINPLAVASKYNFSTRTKSSLAQAFPSPKIKVPLEFVFRNFQSDVVISSTGRAQEILWLGLDNDLYMPFKSSGGVLTLVCWNPYSIGVADLRYSGGFRVLFGKNGVDARPQVSLALEMRRRSVEALEFAKGMEFEDGRVGTLAVFEVWWRFDDIRDLAGGFFQKIASLYDNVRV